MSWIMENFASLVMLFVVIVIVFLLLRSRIKERKQGTCRCGCAGCSGCAAHNKGGKI